MSVEAMAHARQFRRATHTVQGVTGTMKALAAHFGVKYQTVLTRLLLDWSLDKALTEPVRRLPQLKRSSEFPGRIFKVDGLLVKRCANCLDDKALEAFNKRNTSADGLEACCAVCVQIRRKRQPKYALL